MQQQFKEFEIPPVFGNQSHEMVVSEPAVRPEQRQKVEDLLTLLKNAKPKRNRRRMKAVNAVILVSATFMIDPLIKHGLNIFLAVLIATAIWRASSTLVDYALTGRDKRRTLQLAGYEDRRAVGPLLEALLYNDDEVVKAATFALIRLLPQLRATDRHLLSAEHRSFMNDLLGAGIPVSAPAKSLLILAILKALEQVGDIEALSSVEKLSNGEGRGKDPIVRKAAIECLPFLEEAARQRLEQTTLLRASQTSISAEGLLLPAAPGLNDHADQLLLGTVHNVEI